LKAQVEAELKAQEEEAAKAAAAKEALRGHGSSSCAGASGGLTAGECWTANMPDHI